MKKAVSIVLLIVVIISTFGLTPPGPIHAATPSLATLLPADTFSFTEMNTSDIPGIMKTLEDLSGKIGGPASLVGDLDRALSQALGRPATFEKDILSWLGDRVGYGISIPDIAIDSLFTRRQYTSKDPQPEAYALLTVKDEAAADAFLKDVFISIEKSGSKLTRKDDKIGASPAAIYFDIRDNPVIARWPGYLAMGGPSIAGLLDTLKNNKPTLAADPMYKKIATMLKPNNLAMSFTRTPITPPGYVVGLSLLGPSIGKIFDNIVADLNRTPGAIPTATPSPTPTPTPVPEVFELASTFKNLGATGIGVYGDSKTLSMDVAFYIDPVSLQKIFSLVKMPIEVQLQAPAKSISLKQAEQISNKALMVALGSDMAQWFRNGLTFARGIAKLIDLIGPNQPSATSSVESAYGQIETGLKQMFDLDLNKDVLSWLGGEFASYATFDVGTGLAGQSPFNSVMLIQATDAQKAGTFLTKLNSGLTKLTGSSPTTTSDGLFTIPAAFLSPGVASASGPTIGYGLIKNTLLITTGEGLSAAANAARGDGTLSSDADWKEATGLLPRSYQHFWYMHLGKVGDLLQTSMAQSRNPSDQQLVAILSLFKSAALYSTDLGGGASLTTITLILKGQ